MTKQQNNSDKEAAKTEDDQQSEAEQAVYDRTKKQLLSDAADSDTSANPKLPVLSSDDDDHELPPVMDLPVIAIREGVLFPSTESVLTFGRQTSLNALEAATDGQNLVVLITQKDPKKDEPTEKDLYQVGTLALIDKTLKSDDSVNALVRGLGRVGLIEFTQTDPHMEAEVKRLDETAADDEEMKALVTHLQKEFRKAVHMGKPVEFLNFMKLMGGVTNSELVDQIASTLNISTKQKQAILEHLNVKARIKLVIKHLAHEMKVLEIEKDVVHKTQQKFDKHMRENILRERLKTIQKELGELDDEEEVVGEYEQRLKKMNLAPDIKKKIKKEIKRLRAMSPNNPEAGYIRSWLDTVFELPWNEASSTVVDIQRAEKILEKNHYGLQEVKDRILEYIAVMELKERKLSSVSEEEREDALGETSLPTILCFVGPPGVGKTSIGRAIAEALNRKFIKVSLGGVRDEAEIRGHRRTYVGAMPGKIISALKQAGKNNPVFMLDEIDKIGADYKGDPSAALLEALDPEQNDTFEDHYLDMPFDLSQIIFITTANTLDTIPPALKDRLEIIRYSGYTFDEKFHIAKDHLLEKVLQANNLTPEQVKIPDKLIHKTIENYTREAGVRSLERTLSKIMRKTARSMVEEAEKEQKEIEEVTHVKLTEKLLKEYLGPEKFDVTIAAAEDIIGQATGLAYTSVGGDALFIEVALTPGKGKVKLTGKLGDVMKESAQAALTYVKANADQFGIEKELLEERDVHIHVPEGAVPKEGPSAGVTITTAIVSAFTQIPVKKEVAMTGEVTLRGRVLRIGGLKEKSIAAHRAGSKTILIPKDNERDLIDVPDSVKDDIKFIPVATINEVLKHALAEKIKPIKQKKKTKTN